jgi:hypothetical protein
MRRGLLKDLANTPTQIACGWRLYGDLPRLTALSGSEVVVDLLLGTAMVDGGELSSSLIVAEKAASWFDERLQRDGVPTGTVEAASLIHKPLREGRGLRFDCMTVVRTASRTYESRETTRWHPGDG